MTNNELLEKINNLISEFENAALQAKTPDTFSLNKYFVRVLDDLKKDVKNIIESE